LFDAPSFWCDKLHSPTTNEFLRNLIAMQYTLKSAFFLLLAFDLTKKCFSDVYLYAVDHSYPPWLLSWVRPIYDSLDEGIRGTSSSKFGSEAELVTPLLLSGVCKSDDFFSNFQSFAILSGILSRGS